jgi:hypothetical protein
MQRVAFSCDGLVLIGPRNSSALPVSGSIASPWLLRLLEDMGPGSMKALWAWA